MSINSARERGPIAFIPSRVSKMKNSLALEALNDCLGLMGDLGCDVPESASIYDRLQPVFGPVEKVVRTQGRYVMKMGIS
jgi:hypothetical protein